ncbi:MAG TPA: helix-turn-helix transcriptional regulator, partial [Bacillota bacterium]
DRGLTQEQVAERADLHPGYVQKLEGGQRLPSLDALLRLARALDVAVTDLVAVLDEPPAAGGDGGAGGELEPILRTCTPRQRAMILDFIRLLRNHGL